MKMNIPNQLTLFRAVLVPFFVALLLLSETTPWFKWIALCIFIVASLTDWLDGKIARKYNLVTNFGKFMDPLADKLLVCSALIALIPLNAIPAWVTIVIIAREFIISGFRLIAAEKNVVIAASIYGKIKTAVQMVMICIILVVVNDHGFVNAGAGLTAVFNGLSFVASILIWVSLILTIVSLVDYLVKNKEVMKDNN